MQEIGEKIRYFRKERRLILREVSEMTGLSIGFLSQAERGRCNLSISSLQKISNVLRVPLMALFE